VVTWQKALQQVSKTKLPASIKMQASVVNNSKTSIQLSVKMQGDQKPIQQ
jgi:hypothetical protein